jgi:hypothetical protein
MDAAWLALRNDLLRGQNLRFLSEPYAERSFFTEFSDDAV